MLKLRLHFSIDLHLFVENTSNTIIFLFAPFPPPPPPSSLRSANVVLGITGVVWASFWSKTTLYESEEVGNLCKFVDA